MCSFLIMSILVTPNECLNITLHYKLGSRPNKYWNTNKSSLAAWKLDMPRYRTLAICYQVVDRSQFKHLQTFTYNFVTFYTTVQMNFLSTRFGYKTDTIWIFHLSVTKCLLQGCQDFCVLILNPAGVQHLCLLLPPQTIFFSSFSSW